MSLYLDLKTVWKKLGVKGQVRNYSSIELWIVESDSQEYPIAKILPPRHKTPSDIDFDGFKRVDGKSIQGHKNWWKFYDCSTVDISEDERGLRVSVITKVAVEEDHLRKVTYIKKKIGNPLIAILDIKHDSRKKIISYYVSSHGWLDFESTFKMTCYHQIDNARPVFPKTGRPYIRSKRDKSLLNNFSKKVRA